MSQSTRRGSTQVPEAGPSTSRRASTRAVQAVGDSDADEDQPRRGKANTSKRRIKTNDDEDGTALDEDQEDEFGELAQPLEMPEIAEEFRNQPLKKDDAALKVGNLIKEWKDVERKVAGALEMLANSAGALQEALASGDDEDQEALEELKLADRDFRRLLDKLYEAELRRKALEKLRERINEGRASASPLDEMESAIDTQLAQYNSQTSRKKYLPNELFTNFRTILWESRETDEGIPPMKTFIDKEDGDSDSDDEDIEVQGTKQNYKDPITAGWLVKPVRSNVCKHVYSRAAITDHISRTGNRNGSAPCPVAGCNKHIMISALTDDPQLERRVQQHVRRLQEREERAQDGYEDLDEDEDNDGEDGQESSNVRVKREAARTR